MFKKIILSIMILAFFLNWANAAVVSWAKLNGSNVTWNKTLVDWGTHNWENIENEDCLKYPEKCKAKIPDVDAWVPDLKSAGLSGNHETTKPKSYIKKARRLPVTWPKEIMLLILSLLLAWGLFFTFKSKKDA